MGVNSRAVLADLLVPKPVEVKSALNPYPQHVVLGIWMATAAVVLIPARKPLEHELLKVYSIAMTLLPMV